MSDAIDRAPLLVARNIAKTFGATTALKAFDLTLRPGRIHALIGENGAGKSTFIKVLAGLHEADEGELEIVRSSDGHPAIAFIHQDLGLIPGMSAAENVIIGSEYPKRVGLVDWRVVWEKARESLAVVGAEFDPQTPVDELAVADRALVAIARAIRRDARILVLDEPTATLPGNDVHKLFGVLNQLKGRGIGMLYVSHRLREVLSIADEVTVVRDGLLSFRGPVKGLTEAELVAHMVGSDLPGAERRSTVPRSGADRGDLLRIRGLNCLTLRDFDLTIGRGEIVGCVGLRGAGQEVLGRSLAAIFRHTGSIELEGRQFRPRNIDDAIRQGVAFVTGDRENAIVRTMTVEENLFLHPPRTSLPSWLRPRSAERRSTEASIRKYDIRPRLADKLIGELSGGNAQKVVFARGFESRPRVVVLDDPTAGVDMPTRYALYDLMRMEAAKGTGFLVASSDHDEVAAVCDRIHVLREGRIAHTLDTPPFEPERIADLAQADPS
jgi:ribose transport system ATP-binding protein